MSTFIMESDQLNGSDIELAQQLDKNDNIYFYSKSGKITIDLHELLVTLKAKYTFYELPEKDIDIESYCIMLGILANTVSDSLFLIYPENSLISKLNGREFPGPKGLFKIIVCSDFRTAIKLGKSGKTRKDSTKSNTKKNQVLKEKINDKCEHSEKTNPLDVEFINTPAGIKFVQLLSQCEDGITELVNRADEIADAIRCADEAELTLPMQLRMKCQVDDFVSNNIFNLIIDKYQTFKELLFQ